MEAILHALGYVARQLRRSRGFALAKIVTMAACIQAMSALLFRTNAADPLSALAIIGLLAAIVALAVIVPVRRAASLNSIEALLTE
jgi:hypothetical protein